MHLAVLSVATRAAHGSAPPSSQPNFLPSCYPLLLLAILSVQHSRSGAYALGARAAPGAMSITRSFFSFLLGAPRGHTANPPSSVDSDPDDSDEDTDDEDAPTYSSELVRTFGLDGCPRRPAPSRRVHTPAGMFPVLLELLVAACPLAPAASWRRFPKCCSSRCSTARASLPIAGQGPIGTYRGKA